MKRYLDKERDLWISPRHIQIGEERFTEDLVAEGRATGRYAELIASKRHPDTLGLDETLDHVHAMFNIAFTVVLWLAVALGFAAFASLAWPAH